MVAERLAIKASNTRAQVWHATHATAQDARALTKRGEESNIVIGVAVVTRYRVKPCPFAPPAVSCPLFLPSLSLPRISRVVPSPLSPLNGP